ncbi:hypothetical protein D3C72_1445010 [compost metagenome]
MSNSPRRCFQLPRVRPTSFRLAPGFLVMRLMSPPDDPRPYSTDAGPLSTSTCSMFDRSRKYSASSRIPSTNWSAIAEKPRMVTWSRCPSPCDMPIPGTARSTSCMDCAAWSRIKVCGTTFTVCGISRKGASILVALVAVTAS